MASHDSLRVQASRLLLAKECATNHEDLRTLEISALGRPFTLGTLYDYTTDSIVSGITLWDGDDLKRHIRERPQRFNTFGIDASDLTESQFSALDVNGSLKASFWSGLVKAVGSAKYLDHEKTNNNQCRLTLVYKVTTKVQELSMEHLGQNNIRHKDQSDKTLATHVVTAILYGAQAFFVFEREVSENENLQDIQGEGKAKLFGFRCAASLKSANKAMRSAEKFVCSFYGDFQLEKTPRTFQDALQIYHSLPSLLGPNGENAVPLKVWLLPLSSLNVSAQIFRPISGWFLQLIDDVMVDFNELDMRCKVLLTNTGDMFPQMKENLQCLKEMCLTLKNKCQESLAEVLIRIRRGRAKEAELAETLKGRTSFVFTINKLIDFKEQEISVLKLFKNTGKNIKSLRSKSDLWQETGSSASESIKYHVCFIFTSLGDIQDLSHYLKTNQAENPGICEITKEPWFSSPEAAKTMWTKAKLFRDFAEASKNNQQTKFLTVGLRDDKHEGSTIYLYKDSVLVNENFKPPSEPETVTAADVTHNSVTLKVSPPSSGAESIISYSVEICVHGEDGWKQITGAKEGESLVEDLKPNTEYVFRCRANIPAGVGPAFEVRDRIRTLPCSPPGELHVEPNIFDASVTWKKPSEIGQNVQILNYILEYAEMRDTSPVQWNQLMPKTQTETISDLQSDTLYAIRICCACGKAGRSRESETVVCRTLQPYQLQLQDILQDFPDLEARREKAQKSIQAQRFQEIQEKLRYFKNLHTEYKQVILNKLKEEVPSVLDKKGNLQVIMNRREMRNLTPFSKNNLNRWMLWKEKEINVLEALTNMMPNIEIISSQNLFNEIINTAGQVLCFVFTSLGTDDPLLSALSAYLEGTQPEDLHDVNKEPWFTSKKVVDKIRLKAKLFRDFAEANKENQQIKFLAISLTDKSHEGSTIYLYKDSVLVNENFKPPSEPETVTAADVTHNSVTLKVFPPRSGAESIISYSVEICVHGEDGWKQITGAKEGEVTIEVLEPNTEYVFRCRAVTSAGVGPAYEVRDPIRTLPCSPPQELHVEPNLFDASITWKKPSEIGPDVQILNYILEYAEMGDTSPVQWNQLMPKTQRVTISDLQSDTQYAIRVSCDCGEAGRSRESETIFWRTPQPYQLQLSVILHDLLELEARWEKAQDSITAQRFKEIQDKLGTFKMLHTVYKQVILNNLKEEVPSVLDKKENLQVIMNRREMRNLTPFSKNNLNRWMLWKEKEINVLEALTNMMPNTEIISPQNLFNEIINTAGQVLCFVFTSLGTDDPLLSALSAYLGGTQPEDIHDVDKEPWFTSKKVVDKIRLKAKLFSDFAEANKENQQIKFLALSLTVESHEGSTIYLYKDSVLVNENFEPPSKPQTVTAADVTHNSVTLKVSPPRSGAESITSYSVEVCVHGEVGWKQITGAKDGEVTIEVLEPNTEYVFRCRAVTSAGVGPAYEVRDPIRTLPCSPPQELHVEPNLFDASITWKKPSEIGPDVQILNYILEYAEMGDTSPVQWNRLMTKTQRVTISDLQSDTQYAIRVCCDCGEAGMSRESITAHFSTTRSIRPAELLRSRSELIRPGTPSVFKLPLTEEHINIDGCRKFACGEANEKQNRTIVLLGLSRYRALNFINGMINYIVGVEWEDSFRFKLAEEECVTSEVTVYQIFHQEGFRTDYSLTVVDTPKELSFENDFFFFFRRSAEIRSDRRISELLGRLFCCPEGVSEAAAVCLTVRADSAELTPKQRHRTDSLLSVFGKDMLENIRVLVTGADGRLPPVLKSIIASGVPCPKNKDGLPIHFKFNESALFADNNAAAEGTQWAEDPGEAESFDQIFWNMNTKSMKRFFDDLKVMKSKDLFPVKEIIRERTELEEQVENLQERIKGRIGALVGTRASKMQSFRKIFVNCQQCHMTCGRLMWGILAKNGFCTECPGRCYRSVHFIQDYRWRYEMAAQHYIFLSFRELLSNDLNEWIQTSSEYLNKLKEISLKPDPLSVREYVNLIIEGERKEAEPGWEERVRVLIRLRDGIFPLCAIS